MLKESQCCFKQMCAQQVQCVHTFSLFIAAMDARPSPCDVSYDAGHRLHALRRHQEAALQWRLCRTHAPSREALDNLANEMPQQALDHFHNGRYRQASDAWRAAVDLRPLQAELSIGLGDANAALGLPRFAEESYRRAISLSPQDGRSYVALGRLALEYHGTKHHLSSVHTLQTLRTGASLLPTSGDAWMLLGVALVQEGGGVHQAYVDEAITVLGSATQYAPLNADAYWQLGDALSQRGQRRAAVDKFAAAIGLRPTHIEAYSSLARVVSYEVSSSHAARLALRCFRAALRVAPEHPETLHNLGEYMTAKGDPARAALSFERALRAAPSSGLTLLTLGENLQRLCRLEEARHRYEQAAAVIPRSARAQVHALFPLELEQHTQSGVAERQGTFPSLSDLRVEPHLEGWMARASRILEEHGVVVVTQLLPPGLCDEVRHMIEAWPDASEGTSVTTRQPHRRRHLALPMLRNASGRAASFMLQNLHGIVSDAFGARPARLVECGFLTSSPGAQAQAFHADTSPPALGACEAAALKIQLALVEVTGEMGPFEVIPGSHRERMGGGAQPDSPMLAHRIIVQPGDVTLYWSTVQHRGSANIGSRPRPTFHIAVIGDGAAPTGMPYTVRVDDLLERYR